METSVAKAFESWWAPIFAAHVHVTKHPHWDWDNICAVQSCNVRAEAIVNCILQQLIFKHVISKMILYGPKISPWLQPMHMKKDLPLWEIWSMVAKNDEYVIHVYLWMTNFSSLKVVLKVVDLTLKNFVQLFAIAWSWSDIISLVVERTCWSDAKCERLKLPAIIHPIFLQSFIFKHSTPAPAVKI